MGHDLINYLESENFRFKELVEGLAYIHRSVNSPGVDKTFEILGQIFPIRKLFFEEPAANSTWPNPKRWTLTDAYISRNGTKIVDVKLNNLNVVSHSVPINAELNSDELAKHLFVHPKNDDAIPYVTSYYKEDWGFCVTKDVAKQLSNGIFSVVIDSKLDDFPLSYYEVFIPGKSTKEVIFCTYFCHPNLYNDNLSGLLVNFYLAKLISEQSKSNSFHYSYRFLFLPETIGSIRFIEENHKYLKENLVAGWVLTCLGVGDTWSFLESRSGNCTSDVLSKKLLNRFTSNYNTYKFTDRGSDERQFCWPGTDLPFSSIMRDKYNQFAEYHSSLDNLSLFNETKLIESLRLFLQLIADIENNPLYLSKTITEPFLTNTGLYPHFSSLLTRDSVRDLMNVLTYCDGEHFADDISTKCNLEIQQVNAILMILLEKQLIARI